MLDTLELFSELQALTTTGKSMIVMFNKLDLFQEKIREKPLSALFPDYKGESE